MVEIEVVADDEVEIEGFFELKVNVVMRID